MMQAKAAGVVESIWQMRKIIADSIDLRRFEPQNSADWDKAYDKFLSITSK